jgi:hypothetical protein
MKILFLLLLPFLVQAQVKKEKLYYFLSKDSLLGVKNSTGTIIIPAIHSTVFWDSENKLITDDLIFLVPEDRSKKEPHSLGSMYDRTGKFLYHPFFFDNGPDYVMEGLSRFVQNGKVGFVNRLGEVVIPAQYDFVESFSYGYAKYCNGCKWSRRGEHETVGGGDWGYINRKGEIVVATSKKNRETDILIDSAKYLPNPYTYNKLEQAIVDSFYRIKNLSAAYFANYYSPLDSMEKQLRFEIVEYPNKKDYYYVVKAYTYSTRFGFYEANGFTGDQFRVSANGKKYYVIDYDNKPIVLNKWVQQYIKEAKAFLKEHKDAPNKFLP